MARAPIFHSGCRRPVFTPTAILAVREGIYFITQKCSGVVDKPQRTHRNCDVRYFGAQVSTKYDLTRRAIWGERCWMCDAFISSEFRPFGSGQQEVAITHNAHKDNVPIGLRLTLAVTTDGTTAAPTIPRHVQQQTHNVQHSMMQYNMYSNN